MKELDELKQILEDALELAEANDIAGAEKLLNEYTEKVIKPELEEE
jgi:hypothetical protein